MEGGIGMPPMAGIDLLQMLSREFILGNTSTEELESFIENQIKDPFNSGGTNYFRKFAKSVDTQDELDEYCAKFFTQIQDRYPGLDIDLSDYEQHLQPLFTAVYKFFIKNVSKIMYIFIKEFIFNNKNRKTLTAEFTSSKLSTYPKEQYGKKEYYILVTKLHQIVDEIFEDTISLKKFVRYVMKSNDTVYLTALSDAIDAGLVVDNGVVSDMYKLYKESDSFRGDMNRLEMSISESFILPYLEENGMLDVRIPVTTDIETELDDDDDDESDEDTEE